jgi:hypothetical protein
VSAIRAPSHKRQFPAPWSLTRTQPITGEREDPRLAEASALAILEHRVPSARTGQSFYEVKRRTFCRGSANQTHYGKRPGFGDVTIATTDDVINVRTRYDAAQAKPWNRGTSLILPAWSASSVTYVKRSTIQSQRKMIIPYARTLGISGTVISGRTGSA